MRPIDADKLREEWLWNGQNEQVYDTNDFLNSIDAAPTIDVEPVRHVGRWIFDFSLDGSNFYRCSVCNRQEVLLSKEGAAEWFPYCHCGAKMDGGIEDAEKSND